MVLWVPHPVWYRPQGVQPPAVHTVPYHVPLSTLYLGMQQLVYHMPRVRASIIRVRVSSVLEW